MYIYIHLYTPFAPKLSGPQNNRTIINHESKFHASRCIHLSLRPQLVFPYDFNSKVAPLDRKKVFLCPVLLSLSFLPLFFNFSRSHVYLPLGPVSRSVSAFLLSPARDLFCTSRGSDGGYQEASAGFEFESISKRFRSAARLGQCFRKSRQCFTWPRRASFMRKDDRRCFIYTDSVL